MFIKRKVKGKSGYDNKINSCDSRLYRELRTAILLIFSLLKSKTRLKNSLSR